jgi:hypothetical protein
MFDFLDTKKFHIEDKAECVDIFVVNVKNLGLLRTIAAAETLVPIQQLIDEIIWLQPLDRVKLRNLG